MKKIFSLFLLFTCFKVLSQIALQSAFNVGGQNLYDGVRNAVSDSQGNTYACGYFSDITDFDPTSATYTLVPTPKNKTGTFLCKYAANGAVRWARTFAVDSLPFGGAQPYQKLTLKSIATYTDGSVYIFGEYNGIVDFDPGSSTFTLQHTGSPGAGCILKFDSVGTFQWVKEFKTVPFKSGVDPFRMFITPAGEIVIGGMFHSTMDFDPDPVAQDLHFPDTISQSIFVIKLSSNGSYIWGRQIDTKGQDIHVDSQTGIFVTGFFYKPTDFDPGLAVNTHTPKGSNHAMFVLRLGHAGQFHWVKVLDSYGSEWGHTITTDQNHNIIYAGIVYDTLDFDPGPGTFTLTRPGNMNRFHFISKLDTGGNFIWAKKFDLEVTNYNYYVRTDQASNIYLAANLTGTADIDPGPGTYNLITPNNFTGSFITGLNPLGNFLCAATFTNNAGHALHSFETAWPNDFNFAGNFSYTLDADPHPTQVFNLVTQGQTNFFVIKLTDCLQGGTSIEKHTNKRTLKIFPQPSDGLVTIRGFDNSDHSMVVFNLNGQKIQEKQITTAEIKITLPVAGVYFYQVNSDNGVIRGKLVCE